MDFVNNLPDRLTMLEKKAACLKHLFYDRQCHNDNRHFSRCESYFNLLLQRNLNNSSLYEADLTLAALLVTTMRSEFYNRMVLDHGDLYYEDSLYYKHYEQEFDQYLSMLDLYIQQSDPDSKFRDWIWAIYFLNETLAEELVKKTWTSIDTNEYTRQEWFPKNYQNPHDLSEEEEFLSSFIGLYPIFDSVDGIRSALSLKYSASFAYGFLQMPESIMENFHDSIPAYLHELIHYTPPQSRAARNRLAVHLILYSVLNEWTNAVYRIGNDMRIEHRILEQVDDCYFHRLLNEFYGFLMPLYEGSPKQEKAGEPQLLLDSMNMAILQSEIFYHITPDQFIRLLETTELDDIDLPVQTKKELKDKLNHLLTDKACGVRLRSIWKYSANSFATTYNYLLRELRSDITAVILLDITLEDYIQIMMREKGFADNSAKITADGTLYRFGYMTRFLYHEENGTAASSEEDVRLWRACCDRIFKQLKGEGPDSDQHLEHLRTYLDAYEDMAIEKDEGYRTERYGSFLEELLHDEVAAWCSFAESLIDLPRISCLRDIWNHPEKHSLPEEFLKLSETLYR